MIVTGGGIAGMRTLGRGSSIIVSMKKMKGCMWCNIIIYLS